MAATITDVARRAGVSVGTVSRFLNGYTLRDHNTEKIREAIEKLDYRANMIGKALREQKSMAVGVVIPSLTDIYATSVVTAIERQLEHHNYSIILRDIDPSAERKRQKLGFLLERQVDGIILFPFGWGDCLEIFEDFIKQETPIVLVDGDLPGLNTDRVHVDNENASFRAIEKFIHLNHKRIAIISGLKDDSNSKERLQGCLNALRTYNITPKMDWIKDANYQVAGGYKAAMEIFSSPERPTALFVSNYSMTLGAIMAINELNIRIPEDLSFIGFDHFEVFDIIKPPLTVIEQPTEKLGTIAAQLLLKRMNGDYSDFPKSLQVNTRMLIRKSLQEM